MYDTDNCKIDEAMRTTDRSDSIESEKLRHVKELPIVDVNLIIHQNEKTDRPGGRSDNEEYGEIGEFRLDNRFTGQLQDQHDIHQKVLPPNKKKSKEDSKLKENESNRHDDVTKSKERLFKCDICSKTYKFNRTLYAHKRFTHGAKEHFCPICKKPIAYRHQIERHMRTHNPIHERQEEITGDTFKCDVCQKAFSNKNALAGLVARIGNHKIYVHGPRKYECEICGFAFRVRCRLMKHMQGHERKRQKSQPQNTSREIYEDSSFEPDQAEHSDNNLQPSKELAKLSSIRSSQRIEKKQSRNYQLDKSGRNCSKKSINGNRQIRRTHSCSKRDKQFTSEAKLKQHARAKHLEDNTKNEHLELDGEASNVVDGNWSEEEEVIIKFEVEEIKLEPE